MNNAILHASGYPQADKIEDRIMFALGHARLYLAESYDEQDDKSANANTLYISCGGGVSRSSLSAIPDYVSYTSNVVCF